MHARQGSRTRSVALALLALAATWLGSTAVKGAPPHHAPSPAPRPSAPSPAPRACLGILVDARPGRYGPEKLVLDLQQLPRHVPPGWKLDALQTVGDMDFLTGPRSLQSALDAARDLPAGLPVFLALGNHELDNPDDLEATRRRYATYPPWNKRPGPLGSPCTTYSYDLGDMHVAVLNPYYDGRTEAARTPDGKWLVDVSDALFDWLKSDLRSSGRRYKLVVGHAPAFPGYRHMGESLDRNPAHRDRFWSLLQTEGVTAFLSAHDHQWQLEEHDGVYEFDAGAAGGIAGRAVGNGDLYPTLGYAQADSSGITLRMVMSGLPRWQAPSTTFLRTLHDLQCQVLVNTGERAGTPCRYRLVRGDRARPARSEEAWWRPSYGESHARKAPWKGGELGIGYSPAPCGWLNTPISPGSPSGGAGPLRAIFQRVPFRLREPVPGGRLLLGLDGPSAVTVWLNGRKIHEALRSRTWKPSAAPHFHEVDISAHLAALKEGSGNVLAIATWADGSPKSAVGTAVRLTLRRPLPRRWTAFVDCGGSSPSGRVTTVNRAHPTGLLVDARTGLQTSIRLAFGGRTLDKLTEDCGAQVAEGPSFVHPPSNTPAGREFLAPDGHAPTVDLAWALKAPTGGRIVATLSNLDPRRTYTLVALGARRRFTGAEARFAAFHLEGARHATPASPPGVARPDPLTAAYNTGGNFEEGLVAKWTGIVPAGRSLTLTVTGMAWGGQPAREAWLSALKIVEER